MKATLKTPWYDEAVKALKLNGKSKSTQHLYARSVRMLIEFYGGKEPEDITEEEIRDYFLHKMNVDEWASSTLKISYCGIRFFFEHVIRREWHIFKILKAQKEMRLPCVLSREEVFNILRHVKTFHNYTYLTTVYSCGLRLREGLHLQVSDIDKYRMMIHIHRGKGAKDRYVPLPEETLKLLRLYWCTHRNHKLIFPALGKNGKNGHESKTPMSIDSVQSAFRHARIAAGIKKRKVSIHSMRHSAATHLLEAGMNIRAIQMYLGHAKLDTTMIYLHLTTVGMEDASAIINNLMKGFDYDGSNS